MTAEQVKARKVELLREHRAIQDKIYRRLDRISRLKRENLSLEFHDAEIQAELRALGWKPR